MIQFLTGDLFQSNADALVNTVNTEGVMGKGIALQVKRRFPKVFKAYEVAAKRGEIQIGKVQVVPTGEFSPRFVINFPTKDTWRKPSRIEYIEEGLPALVEALHLHGIQSVAIPPLGAGNGGLDWETVRALIANALESTAQKVDILVFEPSTKPFEASFGTFSWTRAQVLIASVLFAYRSLGESLTQLEIQKLAYFLERAGAGMDLRYQPNRYGPYSDRLRHVISSLEGHVITGLNAGKAHATQELSLNYDIYPALTEALRSRSETERKPWDVVKDLIYGWESPYGLELLATLDWCLRQHPALDESNLVAAVGKWGGEEHPEWGQRKAATMKETHLRLAYRHLKNFEQYLQY